MEFFIKKIFEDNVDELVHNQFKKYSRGEFLCKAMVVAKKTGKGFNISTGPEYANELVRYFAEKLGEREAVVSGVVVSTRDLTGELDFKDKKQFMGVKQYILNGEMSGRKIIELCNKLPNAFFGLSFEVDDSVLKIRAKAPKSAKPSTKKEEKPKVDFCKIKTRDSELVDKLVFGVNSFKKVEISHDYIIEEIVVSDELKEDANGDFAKIKEMALRKGILVRKVSVDEGSEEVKEKGFAV
jgi:hypothetical protein